MPKKKDPNADAPKKKPASAPKTKTKDSPKTKKPPASVPEASSSGSPPSVTDKVERTANGQFAKGHTKIGGIKQGEKQKLSLSIQNQILHMVNAEVETDRFHQGLQDLYYEDPKSYYQVLSNLMKFCAPTLQSQSLEIQETQAIRTIDDRLDQLMNSISK